MSIKKRAVQLCMGEHMSSYAIAKEHGVPETNVRRWVKAFKAMGEAGLVERRVKLLVRDANP